MIVADKIDLACGNYKPEGYVGIDITTKDTVADYAVDLQQYPWPIESDSVTEVRCSHYIEHIPHQNVAIDLKQILDKSSSFEEFKENVSKEEFIRQPDGMIKFLNELWRITKPGGRVTLQAPYFSSMRSYGDPTHHRYISDWSFYYANKQYRESVGLGHYDLTCDFDVKYSYVITNEMTLKSEEVRNKAMQHDLNVVDDIVIELTKPE